LPTQPLAVTLAVADDGEILAERDVLNGSGRVVGTEYDITAETLAAIDEAIAQQAAMEARRVTDPNARIDRGVGHRPSRGSGICVNQSPHNQTRSIS
jgi:hypothetical protein